MEAKRCPSHGLVLGEDGKCVICRRNADDLGTADAPPSVGGGTYLAILAAVLVATAGGLSLYKLSQSAEPDAKATGEVVTQPAMTETAAAQPQTAPPRPRTRPVIARDPDPLPPDPEAEEKKLQAAMKRVKVVMYGTSWCPYCKAARRWMKREGIAFREFDIEASETDKIEFKAISPTEQIPTFKVGSRVLVGFDDKVFVDTLRAEAKKYL